MSMRKLFQTHWLDHVVEGHPIKEWYQRIKHDTTKASCTYCNVVMKFDRSGLAAFKRHALSKKHKENRKAAHLRRKKGADISGEYFKAQETIDALALLYPGMNFNCSVDLLPLSVLYKASKQASNSDLVSLLRHLIKSESRNSFVDVYICFFCGEEFVSRPALHGHQNGCGLKQDAFRAPVQLGKPSMHQHDSITSPTTLYRSMGDKISTHASTRRQTVACSYIMPSKDTYISALGLLPKKKAKHVCNKRRNTECEIIDLDEDIPISPSLPRTPKLLLSHLSRDGNENSGDSSSPSKVRRSLFSPQISQTDKETNIKMDSCDESNETENTSKEKPRISRAKSLYSLDITSPLGQLVIKHFKGDPNLHVLSDVESHCLTSAPKKSAPSIQLRERHNTYPVTFKGLFGKFNCSHEHQYKFTRQQKVEFLRRVNTGLDRKSRVLLRKMKRCTVRLAHITKSDLKRWMMSTDEVTVDLKPLSLDEILYWTSPKEIVDINSNTSAVFPSGLTFSSPNVNNVLGLKTCQDTGSHKKYSLSVANYVSEETYAEVTVNRRTVYKSLLSDSAGCDNYLLESECSQASTSVLRHMLSSPCIQKRPTTQVQTSLEGANISLTPQNKSSSSPSHNHQIDNTRKKMGSGSSNILSSVDRNTNSVIGTSSIIDSNNLPDLPSQKQRLVLTARGKGEASVGPLRSGVYIVQIRTALEGEEIKCSITNLEPFSSECSTTAETRTRKRKFGDSKNVLKKSFNMSNETYAAGILKDCFKNPGILKSKKRKCENVVEKADSSGTSANIKKGSSVSRVKFSDSERTLSAKVDIPCYTQAIQDAVHGPTRYSICADSEEKPSTLLIRSVEQDSSGQGPADNSTFGGRIGRQQKRGVTNKPVGGYKKFATIGSFGNSSLLKINNHLSSQKNTYSCNFLHANGPQEEKNITIQETPLYCPKLDTFLNERTVESTQITSDSSLKNIHQIPHVNYTAEVAETKHIENRSASLYTADNRSKKSVHEGQNSLLQKNTFPNHVSDSWEDSTTDSKLISRKDIPSTELKFVTYSSPVPFSPQLRQSSLTNTVSIPRKAEIRKSHLTSFLLKPNGKSLGTLLIKSSLAKPIKPIKHRKTREKLRQPLGRSRRK